MCEGPTLAALLVMRPSPTSLPFDHLRIPSLRCHLPSSPLPSLGVFSPQMIRQLSTTRERMVSAQVVWGSST